MHLGIDFGSQLKGTTAIVFPVDDQLYCRQSESGRSADDFIIATVRELEPSSIFMDAPLSLPLAYFKTDRDNFIYRDADVKLSAMSPMFLGGLTARAMRLNKLFTYMNIQCHETYPKALLLELFGSLPTRNCKQAEIVEWTEKIIPYLPLPLHDYPQNRHQYDALLCWLSGWRYQSGEAISYGDPKEGLIIV